ncbi:STAS domain-containing protein [Metabacillus malikii]|uniref:RsbT co-antagonist protein RsbR n=1 Tax=Metabacillus malikii TaxID=1504265 RepID=A0ABT9ZGZ4_9BACI|nr:STAS domain-containing protein [Metabacillus malikii]MDQ0230808.1 rsbT co-antagonist protein RsbR [Metabacillus malikii]
MHRNEQLYNFLVGNSPQMTEDWYKLVEGIEEEDSVYSTNDPEVIKNLKEQNQDYFLHLHELFINKEEDFFKQFKAWSEELARDQKHLKTPVHFVVREFMNSEQIYINYLKSFFKNNSDKVDIDQFLSWNDLIRRVVNLSIYIYIEEANKNTLKQLTAQKEIINELSSPVILLRNNIALLPLIGDIDTARALIILENTLAQCAELRIEDLCIDLSGVAIIDTMVAHEIFHLIQALNLIGVRSTLCGIRPEIAQTAIQLGLRFDDIRTTATLSQALEMILNN